MRTITIWVLAALLFGAFNLWYGGWRAPLSDAEIDSYMADVERIEEYKSNTEIKDRLRKFLEADDGGEFYMVNLLRYRTQALPAKGVPGNEPPRKVMERYSGAFMPSILSHAGWLVSGGRAASADLERWGVEPDADWEVYGLIRYRSRRDMMEVVTNPQFAEVHPFKFAAIEATRAFPVAPSIVTLGPRLLMGLVILVLALCAQLVVNAMRRPR